MRMYYKRYRNTAMTPVLLIIAIIAAVGIAGGLAVGTTGGINIFKPQNVQAAERGYDLGVKAAIGYGNLCLGFNDATGVSHPPVLPKTCVPTWNKIYAAYTKATNAYFVLCYGTSTPPAAIQGTPCTADTNPSPSAVDQLNTAVALVQSVTPA